MVVDTSALVAILFGEPEAESFARAISEDARSLVSSFAVLETSVVLLARKGMGGPPLLDALLRSARLETVPLTADQAEIARSAYARFGKGRHPAALNLGDCCSYALARASGEPLLFKGQDFAQTDIDAATH
jgi:ribonuclease VapC